MNAIDNARSYRSAQARQAWIAVARDIVTAFLSGSDPDPLHPGAAEGARYL
ncbi:hypothetical protein [Nocardia wallacei]|uniref:hypothetical protein n=1 Tax=Nocardia wallacei TaxID=480035 RepID=UPI00245583DF|nr:hypothetical protein [Nocardia wallacei]